MMNKDDLKLYLILDPNLCGSEKNMCSTAEIAIEHGVTAIQLRAPDWSKNKFYHMALQLKSLLTAHNIPFIINDHVDIALAVDADGVHIGQNDLPVTITRKLIGNKMWLGLSITNLQQLESTPFELVNYLGIGPIFSTLTKSDAAPPIGLEQLKIALQKSALPSVAIGGIHHANAASVLRCGVDGIAVISAICGQQNIAQATQKLKNIVGDLL